MERAKKILILNRVVKEHLTGKSRFEDCLKENKGMSPFYNWNRMFQTEGIGSTKLLGPQHVSGIAGGPEMVSMSKCIWQKSVLHLMRKVGHVVCGLESLERISERDLEQWTSANI